MLVILCCLFSLSSLTEGTNKDQKQTKLYAKVCNLSTEVR